MTATSHRKVFLIGSNVNFGPSQISKVNPHLVVPSLQAQQCEHADLIQNVHLDQQQLSTGGRLPRLRDFPRRDPGHHAGAGLLRGHHSHWRGAGGHHAGVRRGELPLHHQPRPLQAAQKPDQPAHRQPSRVGRAGGGDLLSLPARLLCGEAAVVGARPAALRLHQLPAHRLALRVHQRSPGHRRGQVGSPPGTQADNTASALSAAPQWASRSCPIRGKLTYPEGGLRVGGAKKVVRGSVKARINVLLQKYGREKSTPL